MESLANRLVTAKQTLLNNLAFIEQMMESFSQIFDLEIGEQAKQVKKQLHKVTELYFTETWDTSEVITSSLDLAFSELEFEASEFGERVRQLDSSTKELKRVYEQFVLSQILVMLVSSLEVYLLGVFKECLLAKLNLNERAIHQIASQFNFQNLGSANDAFRTFLEVELCPEGVSGSSINALLQKRHVLVHRMGIVDDRAVRQLGLSITEKGKRIRVEHSEVMNGIELVHRIGEHLFSSLQNTNFELTV